MNTRVSLLFVLFLSACASAKMNDIQPGDAERAIARANGRMVAAIRAGNSSQLVSMYSDSASLLPPEGSVLTGRDAIAQYWAAVLRDGGLETRVTTENVTQSCDMAAERGHYDVTIKGVLYSGKYVVVWRKINGEWKIWNDIFNSHAGAAEK